MAVNSTVFDWKVFKSLKLHVVQPVQIATTNRGNSALLLTQSGKVFAIGKSSRGCLGLGEVTETAEPVELKELSGVAGVCVCGSRGDALAYTSKGKVYVWGNNVSRKRPQLVPELTDVVDARCIEGHYLALTKNGKLYEWRGVTTYYIDALSTTPKVVTLKKVISSIACGPSHSLALTKDGQVYFWGKKWNNHRILLPTKIPLPGETVAKVTRGLLHSLVLTLSGKLYTWGDNYYGLGDPSGSTESDTPVQVGQNIGRFVDIAVNGYFTNAAVSNTGAVYMWGMGENDTKVKTPTITEHLELHQVFANIPGSNYSWTPKTPSSNTEIVKDSSSVAGKLKASCNDEQDCNEAATIQREGHLEQRQTNADCDHAESKIHHLEEYVKNLKKELSELKEDHAKFIEDHAKLIGDLKEDHAKLIGDLKEKSTKLAEELKADNAKLHDQFKYLKAFILPQEEEEKGKHNEAAITQPEERGLQLPVYLAQLEHDPTNVDSSNNIAEDNVNIRNELAKLQDGFKNLKALLFPQEMKSSRPSYLSRGRILTQLAISTSKSSKDCNHPDEKHNLGLGLPEKQNHEPVPGKQCGILLSSCTTNEENPSVSDNILKNVSEIEKINTEPRPTTYDDCNISGSELLLNESALIEINDPELRQFINSEAFVLDDYVVIKNYGESLSPSCSNKDESILDSKIIQDLNESEVGLLLNTSDRPYNPFQDITNEISLENRLDNIRYDINNEAIGNAINNEAIERNVYPEVGLNENIGLVEQTTEIDQNNTCAGRPKKGRKIKFEDQTREIKKRKVNTNQDYITSKGNLKFSKEFRDFHCHCRLKCNKKLSTEEREAIFNNFYKAGTYEARCLLIQNMVKEVPIKRKRNKGSERKTTSREYFLSNEKVCKNIFMQTLRISSCSINVALSKKKRGSVEDERGKAGGHNKLSDLKTEEIINHISRFPRYVSHYCRSVSKSEYLNPETTIPLMYKLYREEHGNPVSIALYKEIFYTKFNLKRKPLKKDTCNVCDGLIIQKKNANLQKKAEDEHQTHLETAEYARKMMNEQFLSAKNNELKDTECISFDLEKTLPLPRIPTNIVFYRRQLWFYNCGVHDSKNRGFCYTWVEGSAGRGAQEVGSCLRKHILRYVPEGTKHLLLWSDSCGGQNRNIKITLLLKAILEEHTTLQDITQHFLVPGHSFLRNDADFSDIESCLKMQQRLYVPTDYTEVIKSCRKKNKLHVERMEKEDFMSTEKLERAITNRKKSITGDQVNWIKFKIIQLKKSKPETIFVKSDWKQDHFIEVNIEKQPKKVQKKNSRNCRKSFGPDQHLDGNTSEEKEMCANFFSSKLTMLWPQGKPISKEKLLDLKSMFHLIPEDCLNFYKGLWSSEDVIDDIDGFSGAPDFELEIP